MLMSVEMAELDPCGGELSHLGSCFQFDLYRINFAPQGGECEPAKACREIADRIYQGVYLQRTGKWSSVNQLDMASHAHSRAARGDLHRLRRGLAIRHQRGRSQDAAVVRLGDGAVHAGTQTEIVCVDD